MPVSTWMKISWLRFNLAKMKMVMAGAGTMFKTGVTSLPTCDTIFRHLYKYYSTLVFYFLSLSEWWSMAKVPYSFPKPNFSSWCRSAYCNLCAFPWQSELPITSWTSGSVLKERRDSSFGKMTALLNSSSFPAPNGLQVISLLCLSHISDLQSNKDLASSEPVSLTIKPQVLLRSKQYHTDQDNASEKVKNKRKSLNCSVHW